MTVSPAILTWKYRSAREQITNFALKHIAQLLLGLGIAVADVNLPAPPFDMEELEGNCYIT